MVVNSRLHTALLRELLLKRHHLILLARSPRDVLLELRVAIAELRELLERERAKRAACRLVGGEDLLSLDAEADRVRLTVIRGVLFCHCTWMSEGVLLSVNERARRQFFRRAAL